MNPPTPYKYSKRDKLINFIKNHWDYLFVVAGVGIIFAIKHFK